MPSRVHHNGPGPNGRHPVPEIVGQPVGRIGGKIGPEVVEEGLAGTVVVRGRGAPLGLKQGKGVSFEGIGGGPLVGVGQVHAPGPGENGFWRQSQEEISPSLEAPELPVPGAKAPQELLVGLHVCPQKHAENEVVHLHRSVPLGIVEAVAILAGEGTLLDGKGKAVELSREEEPLLGPISEDVVAAGPLVVHQAQLRLLPVDAVRGDRQTQVADGNTGEGRPDTPSSRDAHPPSGARHSRWPGTDALPGRTRRTPDGSDRAPAPRADPALP